VVLKSQRVESCGNREHSPKLQRVSGSITLILSQGPGAAGALTAPANSGVPDIAVTELDISSTPSTGMSMRGT